jgi:pimeloyl-ACP methyl ester carboxylesterase
MSIPRSAVVLGATLGIAAAGAVVGLATHRYVERQTEGEDPYEGEQLGSWRGAAQTVTTDDGVDLYVEVDEPDPQSGDTSGPAMTVVLCHGFALNLDSWYFQRRALTKVARVVTWDMRSHGRSGRGPKETLSFERLASDLRAVLDQVVPDGPVVLIGHSMGGMTVLTLDETAPELFGDRIVGVGLVATSAGDLSQVTIGVPGPVGRLVHRAAPGLLALLARQADLVERGRKAGSDIAFLLTRRYAFGSAVPASIVAFCSSMIDATPVDVVAEFTPMFATYDSRDALKPLLGLPVLVVGASRDMLIPVEHGRAIAELLPRSRYIEISDAGHLVLLEHPEVVSEALVELVGLASQRAASRAGQRRPDRSGGVGQRRRRRT